MRETAKSCALDAELRRGNFRGDFCAAFVREFAQWLRRYPQPALDSARVAAQQIFDS
jgi:hypothetical protein